MMLGTFEQEVVSSLARLRQATTRDVLEDLRSRGIDVAYTTVSTTLMRLHRKRLVDRKTEPFRGGERHVYLYRDIEREYIDSLLGNLLTAFGRKGVVHLTERLGDLSPKELEELRKRLEK